MKDIPGYEGIYRISEDGVVESYPREFTITNRFGAKVVISRPLTVLKQVNKGRYARCALTRYGKTKHYNTHRLVALAYIPNPNNMPQVNHIDGVRYNNNVNNLEWCTASQNITHAFSMGLINKKNMGKGAKGRMPQTARDVLDLYTGIFYESMKAVESTHSITPNTLRAYLTGRYAMSPKGIMYKSRFLVL